MGHNLRLSGTFLFDSVAPYPDVPVDIAMDWSLASGAGAGQANRAFSFETPDVAASGTIDMDIASLTGPIGSYVPEYLHAMVIRCITPGGKGTLTPHATNGWTGMGSAYTVPVSNGPFVLTSDVGITISSTNKVITLTNNGSATAKYRIFALMRDT